MGSYFHRTPSNRPRHAFPHEEYTLVLIQPFILLLPFFSFSNAEEQVFVVETAKWLPSAGEHVSSTTAYLPVQLQVEQNSSFPPKTRRPTFLRANSSRSHTSDPTYHFFNLYRDYTYTPLWNKTENENVREEGGYKHLVNRFGAKPQLCFVSKSTEKHDRWLDMPKQRLHHSCI